MMTLLPFQLVGAEFLRSRRRAALFDDMRLGKTAQALMALPRGAAAIVVCPKIAMRVWEDEARAWRPDLRPAVLSGRLGFRWPARGEIVILNYDILPAHPERQYGAAFHLIADEAHYLKNSRALRSKRFKLLREALPYSSPCWLLTGTPLLNKPPDLWNVLGAAQLAFAAFPQGWPGFCDAFHAKEKEIRTRGGKVRKVLEWGKAEPWVKDAVAGVALRRRRADVLPELPPKRQETLRIDCLTPEATDLCDAMLARLAASGKRPEEALEWLMDHGGTEFGEIAQARQALAMLKIRAAGELLDAYREAGRPVVLFSAHRAPIDAIGLRPGWGKILGGTIAATRETLVASFQAGKLEGLACTIGAAGTGIKLTAAADVIFIDQSWSPMENQQAEDRVVGFGQTQGVTITVLQADHKLDEMLVRIIRRKQAIAASAIG